MTRLLPTIQLPDPACGVIDPHSLCRARAVWVEIGFGGGEHLAAQALAHPDILFLGAEPFQNGVASALRHIQALGLANIRLHVGDGRALIDALPSASVDKLFLLFPDPWPKARHRKRRLLNDAAASSIARVLKPGAGFRFVTDWADYAEQALACVLRNPDFVWQACRPRDWCSPPPDHVTTRYEAKRLGDIRPLFLDFLRSSPGSGAAKSPYP